MTGPAETAARFRRAVEARDADAVVALFAADAVFNTPSRREPFEGRDAIRPIVKIVLGLFGGFHYTDEYGNDEVSVLQFACRIGDEEAQGVDILRIVDDQVVEFTVMIRPYAADHALRENMIALLDRPEQE